MGMESNCFSKNLTLRSASFLLFVSVGPSVGWLVCLERILHSARTWKFCSFLRAALAMKLFQDSHCPTYNLCLSVYVSVCVYILRWKQNYIGILAKRIWLLTQQNYKMSMRMTITSMTTTRTKMTTSSTTATTIKHQRKGGASLFARTCFFPISV